MAAEEEEQQEVEEEEEEPCRPSADQMDEERREAMAYEYLCRLEEAKCWMEECLKTKLPPTVEMEESLKNGVLLARLANFFAPQLVSQRKIFDPDESRYKKFGLHFRHTDNTVQWMRAMAAVGLPEVFCPDTADVYDKKNMPKAVFCLHALSIFLYRKGLAPPIRDFSGDVAFTKEEISMMAHVLAERGIQLPNFARIDGILSEELSADEAQMHAAVAAINAAVDEGDVEKLLAALQEPAGQVHFVNAARGQHYLDELTAAKQRKRDAASTSAVAGDMYDLMLNRVQVQSSVDHVNEREAAGRLDALIDGEAVDEAELVRCLEDSALRLPRLQSAAAPLYLRGLQQTRRLLGRPLTSDEIASLIKVLNATAEVNWALDGRKEDQLFRALVNPSLDLVKRLDDQKSQSYMDELLNRREQISNADPGFPYVMQPDIFAGVDRANRLSICTDVDVLAKLLKNTRDGDLDETVKRLEELKSKDDAVFDELIPEYGPLYHARLRRACLDKEADGDCLTAKDVGALVEETNREVKDATRHVGAVRQINETVGARQFRAGDVVDCLVRHAGQLSLPFDAGAQHRYAPELKIAYDEKLATARRLGHVAEDEKADWLPVRLSDDNFVYVNLPTGAVAALESPPAGVLRHYLSAEEIKDLIAQANKDFNDWYRDHEREVVKAQSQVRTYLSKKKTKQLMENKNREDEAARKIQNFFRRHQSAKDYQEFGMERLKSDIAKQVRANRRMEENIADMDIQIGLLVRNRVSLQDVVGHRQKMAEEAKSGTLRRNSEGDGPTAPTRIRRLLSKTQKASIDCYQNLLYTLQTEPIYITRLLFCVGSSNRRRLIDSILLPLYSYGGQTREQYYFGKFVECATAVEVRRQITSLDDVGNVRLVVPSVVLAMIKNVGGVGEESGGGRNVELKFREAIAELLKDQSEHLNTDPIEIYKYLIGEPTEEIVKSEAAGKAEVAVVLSQSMFYLAKWASRFLDIIVSDITAVPYFVRLFAKSAYLALANKFAYAPERDVVKAMGVLVFEEYFHDMIAISKRDGDTIGEALSQADKKKLASVAKLLQFGVANRGFGVDNAHLTPLNESIRSFHEKLRTYFFSLHSDTDCPEVHFSMDQHSDTNYLHRPTVHITLADLLYLHQILLDHRGTVAPNSDRLNYLLDECGTRAPTVKDVVSNWEGGVDEKAGASTLLTLILLAKQWPASLAASASQTVPLASDVDAQLFLSTKKNLVDVILCCEHGDSVLDMLAEVTADEEEAAHKALLAGAQTGRELMTLEDKKALVGRNLVRLEEVNLITRADGYQAILSSIASDIRRESSSRAGRKEEMSRLAEALERLKTRRRYFDEQLSIYNQYIDGCLQNLGPKVKRRSINVESSSKRASRHSYVSVAAKSFKYSGDKLQRKGLLVSVDDVADSQLKNVAFTLKSSTDVPGQFEISMKGPANEEVETQNVAFQEILQAQQLDEPMLICRRARFDVDQLVFYLNKKFYASTS